ncbi:MAG: glycosyltransferase family 39 protein [Candidatus Micrarchaeota archaeon]
MKLSLKLPDDDRRLILLLVALFLLTRLPLLTYLPLTKDEAIYAVMIEEQVRSPTLVPTFLGYPVSWKPILFFWVYSILSRLPLPLELAYRLPSLLFGMISVPLLYHIFREAGGASRTLAFFSTAIFQLSLISLYPNSALLLDSLMFLIILLAFYLYTQQKAGRYRFLLCAALSILAFFTKFILAAMIPVLAAGYFWQNGRKTLKDPLFLLSLLAVPSALAVNVLLFGQAGITTENEIPLASNVVAGGLGGQLNSVFGALVAIFLGAGFWAVLSLQGILKFWKESRFMALWASLTLLPLLLASLLFWYYLPVLPAISFFSALLLLRWDGKERPDALFAIVFCMLAAVSLASAFYIEFLVYGASKPEMEAGLLLAGKENVLIIGRYPTTLVGYKMLTEYHELGHPLDFGWVTSSRGMPQEAIAEYLRDYHSDSYPAADGSFNEIYTTNKTFRKDTNITSFDYIAVTAFDKPEIPNSTIVYEKLDITVYKVARG